MSIKAVLEQFAWQKIVDLKKMVLVASVHFLADCLSFFFLQNYTNVLPINVNSTYTET